MLLGALITFLGQCFECAVDRTELDEDKLF